MVKRIRIIWKKRVMWKITPEQWWYLWAKVSNHEYCWYGLSELWMPKYLWYWGEKLQMP